ncbi:MAG: Riboflavin synthase [Phycisphaerae bacterium]|nr:Riboflavin synthase [Phycisphaerae bacterium]
MFSGIIEGTAIVRAAVATSSGRRLTLQVNDLGCDWPLGSSVAVNGVCLTVAAAQREQIEFDVISETLQRSNLGKLSTGAMVNIERALPASGRIDGHWVQGHVDAVVPIVEIERHHQEWRLWLAFTMEIQPLLVPKGSVAINGVSLTIASVTAQRWSVALIPTTLQRTNMAALQIGHEVNIETDIIARTLWHQLQLLQHQPPASGGGLAEALERYGFR